MKFDEYKTIINDQENYKDIAKQLVEGEGAVLFAWTDGQGTQFDILLAICPDVIFENDILIQGGVKSSDLFVSVMRIGSFGFNLDTESHPNYYAEKLGIGTGETANKFAEFINSIKKEIKTYEA